jgi:hypothetical protein
MLMLVGFAHYVSAQIPLSVGVHAGLNFSTPEINPPTSETFTRPGFGSFTSLEFGISDAGFIQIEFGYIQKIAKSNSTLLGRNISVIWKFDYIEIPILLKAKFGSSSFKTYVLAGPCIGISLKRKAELISGNQEDIIEDQNQENVFEDNNRIIDIKKITEPTDFVIYVGIGGEYRLNEYFALTADIRYSLGMQDVKKSIDVTWRNSGYQFFIGTRFTL